MISIFESKEAARRRKRMGDSNRNPYLARLGKSKDPLTYPKYPEIYQRSPLKEVICVILAFVFVAALFFIFIFGVKGA